MGVEILTGDCRQVLKTLPEKSINCCVTSPPYWGLRDYGVDGQLGLEKTPEEYVEKMVEVFEEVRRVLRDDGTLWLNLGDSYCAGGGSGKQNLDKLGERLGCGGGHKHSSQNCGRAPIAPGMKQKDLVGIPWMVAFALRSRGWFLRSDIIWNKPNPMPESVTDRPTKSHEYIFLLSKSSKYYYDHESIKERCQSNESDIKKMVEGKERIGGKNKTLVDKFSKASSATNIGQKRSVGDGEKRNKRSVWKVSTAPYKGAHFACFPEKLIEPCILAGCPEGGTVLDPFGGSGTTGRVAIEHRRDAILIELNPEYIELQKKRTSNVQQRLV